jgi:xanthine dehydrogenase accessory factor
MASRIRPVTQTAAASDRIVRFSGATDVPEDWREALLVWERAGIPHVLVTVIEALGSTPREAGAKMVVRADAQSGSIGGGNLEYQAAVIARRLLEEGRREPVTEKVLLGPDLGQCCGGGATLFFEPLGQPALTVALFGAGHVGQALVRVLEGTGVRVLWIDPRPEAFPAVLPQGVSAIMTADPAAEVAVLPRGVHALIMTHSHDLDFAVLAATLRRGGFASVGLIGSDTKWARFRRRLAEAGIPKETIAAVICPIGIPGVGGKRPAEIAIATAARLLQHQPAHAEQE